MTYFVRLYARAKKYFEQDRWLTLGAYGYGPRRQIRISIRNVDFFFLDTNNEKPIPKYLNGNYVFENYYDYS